MRKIDYSTWLSANYDHIQSVYEGCVAAFECEALDFDEIAHSLYEERGADLPFTLTDDEIIETVATIYASGMWCPFNLFRFLSNAFEAED